MDDYGWHAVDSEDLRPRCHQTDSMKSSREVDGMAPWMTSFFRQTGGFFHFHDYFRECRPIPNHSCATLLTTAKKTKDVLVPSLPVGRS